MCSLSRDACPSHPDDVGPALSIHGSARPLPLHAVVARFPGDVLEQPHGYSAQNHRISGTAIARTNAESGSPIRQ